MTTPARTATRTPAGAAADCHGHRRVSQRAGPGPLGRGGGAARLAARPPADRLGRPARRRRRGPRRGAAPLAAGRRCPGRQPHPARRRRPVAALASARSQSLPLLRAGGAARRGGVDLRRRPGPAGDPAGARLPRAPRRPGLLLLHRPPRRDPSRPGRGDGAARPSRGEPLVLPPACLRLLSARGAAPRGAPRPGGAGAGRRRPPALVPRAGRLSRPAAGARAGRRRTPPGLLDPARLRHRLARSRAGGCTPAEGRRRRRRPAAARRLGGARPRRRARRAGGAAPPARRAGAARPPRGALAAAAARRYPRRRRPRRRWRPRWRPRRRESS